MNLKYASDNIIKDLVLMSPNFTERELEFIKQRMEWMYSIGYTQGRASVSNQKEVILLDKFGKPKETYPSAVAASRSLRIPKTGIKACANGEYNQTHGYKFVWKKDYAKLRANGE